LPDTVGEGEERVVMPDCNRCRVGCKLQVELYRKGSEAAFDRLYKGLRELAASWVRKGVASSRLSEYDDILSEAWIRIWTQIGQWKGDAHFCGWARVVTHRVALDWVTRMRVHRPLPDGSDPLDLLPGTSPEEIKECFEAIARNLLPEVKALYEMWKSGVRPGEMTWQEIARKMDCCEKTARIRYKTLMRILARGLIQQGLMNSMPLDLSEGRKGGQ
jgi:RNA polymerase sigma factor (sigma-70 family)